MSVIGSIVRSKQTGMQAVITKVDKTTITVSLVHGGEIPVSRSKFYMLFDVPVSIRNDLDDRTNNNGTKAYKLLKRMMNFDEFYNKYPLKYSLDDQQKKAVQAIDGANLVLAVPGSGKTTVLTYRLGYMTIARGIDPRHILTMTYTNAAKKEMKERLEEYFGDDIKGDIHICTINSFANEIVRKKRGKVDTADEDDTNKILRGILSDHKIRYYDDILKIYSGTISYVKSKLRDEWDTCVQIAMKERGVSKDFADIFNEYNEALEKNGKIDFNDQNNFAYEYLLADRELLNKFRNRYRYICVDEAQDTNEVQHKLIKLIGGSSRNIFMVGDDDQSIYSFNGSCPEILYRFKEEYGGKTLNIETNYRSTAEIVEFSRDFIKRGTGKRAEKDIKVDKGNGEEISHVVVENMSDQAKYLVKEATNKKGKTAILYRENNTGIVLAYYFLKNKIQFCFASDTAKSKKKIKPKRFSSGSFRKVINLLRLADNPRDFDAFMKIYKEIDDIMSAKAARTICSKVRNDPYAIIIDQVEIYAREYTKSYSSLVNIRKTGRLMKQMKKMTARNAIYEACDFMLGDNEFQIAKTNNLLSALADENESLDSFIRKLDHLYEEIDKKSERQDSDGIILSTVHGSKGLEYDTVFLADVYDGVWPTKGSDEDDLLMAEERRVMYVAITRAKDELYVINMKNNESSFFEESFE